MKDHPERRVLADEIHARPYLRHDVPVSLSHLAVQFDNLGSVATCAQLHRRALVDLCEQVGFEPPADHVTHYLGSNGVLSLRWEQHTEFTTWTFFTRSDKGQQPFATAAIDRVPQQWRDELPGHVVSAVHMEVETTDFPERTVEEIARDYFDGRTIAAGYLLDKCATMWTDYAIRPDGFMRILVRSDSLDGRRIGRLIQRILEMETYRLFAMLGFSLAKIALGRIAVLEEDLKTLVNDMATHEHIHSGTDEVVQRALLDKLSGLAIETENIIAETAWRFSATRAYYKIVLRRLQDMEEKRYAQLMLAGDLMTRRLSPAMETCETASTRLERLSERLSRAANLLRTRVDISLEEKNNALLKSMDRRAHVQIKLQQTVEGLSIVAISYYMTSLFGYLAKGMQKAGWIASADHAVAVALPVIVVAVWWGSKHIRKMLEGE